MDIVNTGRKIFLNAFKQFGEEEILKGKNSEIIKDYLTNLSDEEKTCVAQYLCREYFNQTINGKPMLNKFFEAATATIRPKILRYVKQIEFEQILEGKRKIEEHEAMSDLDKEYDDKYRLD